MLALATTNCLAESRIRTMIHSHALVESVFLILLIYAEKLSIIEHMIAQSIGKPLQ